MPQPEAVTDRQIALVLLRITGKVALLLVLLFVSIH
jgi:hypothetical protein